MPVDNNGNIDVGSISKGEKQRYLSLGIGAFIIIMIFSTVLMLMGGQFHDPDQNKPIKNQEFGEKTVIPVEDMTMGSGFYHNIRQGQDVKKYKLHVK